MRVGSLFSRTLTTPLAKPQQSSRACQCNGRVWLACAPRTNLAIPRCIVGNQPLDPSPCLLCGTFVQWSNCSTNCQGHSFPSACFFISSAIILAISSLFSRMIDIVRSCFLISAFCQAFSRTEMNSQKMQYDAHRRLNAGAGLMTDESKSMHTRTINGEKYLRAFSHVFFNPVDVVASPNCLALYTPNTRSTIIAIIIIAEAKVMSKMCAIKCSLTNSLIICITNSITLPIMTKHTT